MVRVEDKLKRSNREKEILYSGNVQIFVIFEINSLNENVFWKEKLFSDSYLKAGEESWDEFGLDEEREKEREREMNERSKRKKNESISVNEIDFSFSRLLHLLST